MPHYTGGCLCSAVRIEITAAPMRAGICHCLDCRKRQGALFHSFAVFPTSAVKITGELRTYKTRNFCPVCGSPIYDDWGDGLEVHLGCLDAPNQITPTYESWTVRRESWLPAFPLERRYERDRE